MHPTPQMPYSEFWGRSYLPPPDRPLRIDSLFALDQGATEPQRPQRSLTIFMIEARDTNGRLDLHVLDWWNLLGLALEAASRFYAHRLHLRLAST